MKALIALISAAVCLVVSLIIAWFVWEIGIEGRAFHCMDEGIPGLSLGILESLDAHRSAGDHLLEGWTWSGLRGVQRMLLLACCVISVGGGIVAYKVGCIVSLRLREMKQG